MGQMVGTLNFQRNKGLQAQFLHYNSIPSIFNSAIKMQLTTQHCSSEEEDCSRNVCVSFANMENQRLKYIYNNKKNLRGEKYKIICEDVHQHQNTNNTHPVRSRQQVILAPSFTGDPRYICINTFKMPWLLFINFTHQIYSSQSHATLCGQNSKFLPSWMRTTGSTRYYCQSLQSETEVNNG